MQGSQWQRIHFCNSSTSLNENDEVEFIERMWYSEKKLIPGDHCGYFELLQREPKNQERPVNTNITFQHIITIRDVIFSNAKANRIDLWKRVREVLPGSIHNDDIEGILIVVIRLFLMIRVSFCESRVYVPPDQRPFLRNQSLYDILKSFQTGRPLSDFNLTDRYPLWFNAIDLEKKAGLQIGWTDYMTEHLTIQSRKILLFRHIEVLKYLEQSETVTAELLSQNFIAETMSSILLFFPTGNRLEDYNQRFLPPGDRKHRLNRLINKDSQEVEVTRLFQDYPVWHQRLAYILEISKNPTDWSLKRLWYDDREESLWWAKWALITAVFLAIIFGLIQSITGIIQATGAG